ncbi:hypothetical protein DB30_02654 [Enhygromyxa salina]|uniref:Lipoprotein n=1 Tax=Enhygromyxa salina TaxID=215803 RepID=A0A0C2A7B7_9BACT|nr:hypothetical protein [Enhygromyxa salina]KIG19373.1 hypothetical protein DB30_02654 [Enhygromyxa salina]
MFRLRRALLTPIFLASFAVSGCKPDAEAQNKAEREANAKRVTSDSTEDASEPIVDEDYRFRLGLPGPGWKLLREGDASKLQPDAIAAAVMTGGGGAYGVVIIERLPGTTLDQAKALVWDDTLPDLVIEAEVDLEFQGLPAKRRTFAATVEGRPFHFVSTIFTRQGYLHQLLSWSANAEMAAELLPFHAAFELLDGEITGRNSTRPPIMTANGVGWRIRDGRYESALSELRARPAEGWRFVIGAELEQLGSDAEIVMVSETTNAYIALTVERVSKDRVPALVELNRRLFNDDREAPAIATSTRKIAGREVEFRSYHEGPLEFVHGVYPGDASVTQVHAWYPLGLADSMVDSLEQALAGLEQIPASEREQLRQELLGSRSGQRRFTVGRAFRAGELLDYEHRVAWTMPEGFWQVDTFERALGHTDGTVLKVSELDLGVYAALEVFESDATPANILTELVGDDKVLSRDTVVVDGLTVQRARSIDSTQSPPMSYEFAIADRGDFMIAMSAWTADETPAHREAMTAALAGLDYERDIEQTTVAGGVYTDVIRGFSFKTLAGMGQPKLQDLGLGHVAAWTKGSQELVSMVIVGANIDDEAWTTSFFEQLLRDRVGTTHPLGQPERGEGKLGGHTTRHLSWDQGGTTLAADLVVRDGVVYCILYVNLESAQIQTVQRSWTLLE